MRRTLWKFSVGRGKGGGAGPMFSLFQVVFIGLYFRLIAVLLKERINLHVIIYEIPKDFTLRWYKIPLQNLAGGKETK
jgi:hypothetical protein